MNEHPDTETRTSEKPKKKAFRRLLLLLLLLVLGTASFFVYRKFTEDRGTYKDRDARLGILPGMSEEEVQQRLNTVVSEGMMNVSMNPHPVFLDGKSPGTLRIENIEQNHYSYQVSITLDDTGEEIYESGLLDPGYFIDEAKLSTALAKGEYPATARFLAYEGADEKPIGAAVVKISITVEK
ncbi:MAG: hypothetical protein RR446_06760 [Lachnospiraceae bacterium]